MTQQLLEGLKVVEMATFVAGPGAAGLMADWGADVIKVEGPGGDPIRWNRPPGRPGGSSPNFELDNRGKRSIVVDFRKPAGAEVMHRLARWTDVFITSLRPESTAKARIDYASLSAVNARLIYASITGYGLEGPMANVPAYDITAFWSRSGLLGEMIPPGGAPDFPRPAMGDHVTALSTALGVMTALWSRERTGRGQLIESSLLRSGSYAGAYDMAERLRGCRTIPIVPRAPEGVFMSPVNSAGQTVSFRAAQERWLLLYLANEDDGWPRVFRAVGLADWIGDPRLANAQVRCAHGAELLAALDAAFALLPRDEVGAALDAEGIIWSPIHRADTAMEDPVNQVAGCFVEVDDKAGGTFTAPAPPVRFPGSESPLKGPVPQLGEHTTAILAQLGYSAAEAAALRDTQAVA